jgi:uncharacterized membrane protein YphA (DoxX/SURF4 family)
MLKKVHPVLNFTLWVIRIMVGGLFIFSGLVKANDPKGLAYKMAEFFEAWAVKDNILPDLMHWLNDYVLEFAILMIVLEIIAGLAIILGYRFRLFSWFILLLTLFFTFLTAYVLFSGNIKACGCFGDCIPLTPTETFTKDIILLILIGILLLFRRKIKAVFSFRIGSLIMLLGLLISVYINFDVLKNLPYKDCLPYKIGNNISKEMERPANYQEAIIENKLVYKNLKTGKEKAFTDLNKAPWADTLNWKYIENIQTEISPAMNEPKILDFSISSVNGENITDRVLNYNQNLILLFVHNTGKAKMSKSESLRKVIAQANESNTPIVAVSPSSMAEIVTFKEKYDLDIEFHQIDGVVCKTAMRTNPGIILLNQGTIMGKWSYNNFKSLLPFLKQQDNIPLFPTSTTETTAQDSSLNNE